MKRALNILLVGGLVALTSCADYKRENKYDSGAAVNRDYELVFDHIEVVNEEATENVNGLLDVVEKADLHIYLKNNGPDPCMIRSAEWDSESYVSGFYIQNSTVGINDGGFRFGDPNAESYDVQYIDPGATNYFKVDVRTYEYLDSDQDIPCWVELTDWDGQIQTVNFNVHIE